MARKKEFSTGILWRLDVTHRITGLPFSEIVKVEYLYRELNFQWIDGGRVYAAYGSYPACLDLLNDLRENLKGSWEIEEVVYE